MPYTPNTTWVDGSGGGTPLSAARLNNMEPAAFGAYFAYTPTWTASGTAPAIGNAAVTGRYVQIGKLVHAYGLISFGATSTYGTGQYRFALPVAASGNASRIIGCFDIYDASSNNAGFGTAEIVTSTTVQLVYPATYLGARTTVAQTAPWTWTTSDFIAWNLTYEAA